MPDMMTINVPSNLADLKSVFVQIALLCKGAVAARADVMFAVGVVNEQV